MRIVIVYLAVIFLAVLLFFHSRHRRPDPKELASISAIAQPIIAAIERYRANHSRYPDSLDKLVPNYIPSIPNPNWGLNKWDYGFDGDKSYSISVRLRENDYQSYVYERYPSGKSVWLYDQ